MPPSRDGSTANARGGPSVCAGIVSPTGVQVIGLTSTTPDDHFTAGPDCRVVVSCSRRVNSISRRPTVCPGIVSPARVQKSGVNAAPDDHFTASPDRGGDVASSRSIGDAGTCPCVRSRIESFACV